MKINEDKFLKKLIFLLLYLLGKILNSLLTLLIFQSFKFYQLIQKKNSHHKNKAIYLK